VEHRDIVSDGFPNPERVDAIFLDLPNPWEVVPHVERSLKRGEEEIRFIKILRLLLKEIDVEGSHPRGVSRESLILIPVPDSNLFKSPLGLN